MPRRLLLLALASGAVLAAGAAAPAAQVAFLPPVDEASGDASFVAFRGRLLAAAAARDTAAVLGAFAPEATVSFGTQASGAAGVREVWFAPGAESTGAGDFFATLVRTLAMGSAVDGGVVSAPYLFTRFPEAYDAFGHVVVVGEEVRVRNAPTLSGGVLTSVTHAVLPTAYERPLPRALEPVNADGYWWVPVHLLGGERGWVADAFVWSPVGYRIGFEKRGSAWRVLYFVAGD